LIPLASELLADDVCLGSLVEFDVVDGIGGRRSAEYPVATRAGSGIESTRSGIATRGAMVGDTASAFEFGMAASTGWANRFAFEDGTARNPTGKSPGKGCGRGGRRDSTSGRG
jgi:hypothetical protein